MAGGSRIASTAAGAPPSPGARRPSLLRARISPSSRSRLIAVLVLCGGALSLPERLAAADNAPAFAAGAPNAPQPEAEPFMRPAAARSVTPPSEAGAHLPAPLLRLFTSPPIGPADAPPASAPDPTPPTAPQAPRPDTATGAPVNAPAAHDSKGRIRLGMRSLTPERLSEDDAPAPLPTLPRPMPLAGDVEADSFTAQPAASWRAAGPRLARRHGGPGAHPDPAPDTPDQVSPVTFHHSAARPFSRQPLPQPPEPTEVDPAASPPPPAPSAQVTAERVVDPSQAARADAAPQISAAASQKPSFERASGATVSAAAPNDRQADAALAAEDGAAPPPAPSQVSGFITKPNADAPNQAVLAELIAHRADAPPPTARNAPPPALKGFSALLNHPEETPPLARSSSEQLTD